MAHTVVGTGPGIQNGDTVTVDYKGRPLPELSRASSSLTHRGGCAGSGFGPRGSSLTPPRPAGRLCASWSGWDRHVGIGAIRCVHACMCLQRIDNVYKHPHHARGYRRLKLVAVAGDPWSRRGPSGYETRGKSSGAPPRENGLREAPAPTHQPNRRGGVLLIPFPRWQPRGRERRGTPEPRPRDRNRGLHSLQPLTLTLIEPRP